MFRPGTLGYADLLRGKGTENFGGLRPGCWINAIPAGGLVLLPDYTSRCVCSYLNKATVALQPINDARILSKPFLPGIPIEDEEAKVPEAKGGRVTVQSMLRVGAECSGHRQLLFIPESTRALLEIELPPVDSRDNYALFAYLTSGPRHGSARFTLNGAPLGGIVDCHREGWTEPILYRLGYRRLSRGRRNVLKVALEERKLFGIDALYLLATPEYILSWQVLGPLELIDDWDEEKIAGLEGDLRKQVEKVSREGSVRWKYREADKQGTVQLVPDRGGAGKLYFALSFLRSERRLKCPLHIVCGGKYLLLFLNAEEVEPEEGKSYPTISEFLCRLPLVEGEKCLILGGIMRFPGRVRAWIEDPKNIVTCLPTLSEEQ